MTVATTIPVETLYYLLWLLPLPGAGKSTTFGMLTGEKVPTSGHAFLQVCVRVRARVRVRVRVRR